MADPYFDTTTTTSLPQWYTDAQIGLASQAGANFSYAQNQIDPAVQATKGAADQLNTQAGISTGNLNSIASGAANPWLANGDPNTQTAFGQLFANQQKQLQGVLPDIQAQSDAGDIASGNFGSLRGLTAGNTARTKAFNDLAVNQSNAWNQAQQTGVQAATGAVNTNVANLSGQTNAGTFNVRAPLDAVTSYANVVGSLGSNLPSTVTKSPSQFQADAARLALTQPQTQESTTPLGEINARNSVFTPAGGGLIGYGDEEYMADHMEMPHMAMGGRMEMPYMAMGGGLSQVDMINRLFAGA